MTKRKIIILSVFGVIALLLVVGAVLAWYMLTQQTTGIYVDNLPSKGVYYVGEELQLDGLQVNEKKRISTYDKLIATDKLTITGFDSSAACEVQNVTVTYGKFTTSFAVVIMERPTPQKVVIGVKIQGKDGAELKKDYQLYEDLDVENIELVVAYNDMSTKIIPATHPDVKIEGFDYRKPATNLEVRIIYQGFFDRMYVNIIM